MDHGIWQTPSHNFPTTYCWVLCGPMSGSLSCAKVDAEYLDLHLSLHLSVDMGEGYLSSKSKACNAAVPIAPASPSCYYCRRHSTGLHTTCRLARSANGHGHHLSMTAVDHKKFAGLRLPGVRPWPTCTLPTTFAEIPTKLCLAADSNILPGLAAHTVSGKAA